MLDATTVSVCYLQQDDRLALDCADGTRRIRLILTRRLTRRLLNACIGLLERSSAVLAKTPAALRSEVIGMEHLSALKRAAPAPAPPGPALRDLGSVLVTQIDLQTAADAFSILLQSDGEPVARLALSRSILHRTVALIDEWAERAEWDIGSRTGWLTAAVTGAMPGRVAS